MPEEAWNPDVRHPLPSAVDLFRSRWTIGWGVAPVAFALHVPALTLTPISIGQALLAGGLASGRARQRQGTRARLPSWENRSHGASLGAKLASFCNGTHFRYVFR